MRSIKCFHQTALSHWLQALDHALLVIGPAAPVSAEKAVPNFLQQKHIVSAPAPPPAPNKKIIDVEREHHVVRARFLISFEMTNQRWQRECAEADWPTVAYSNHDRFASRFGQEPKPARGKRVAAADSLS